MWKIKGVWKKLKIKWTAFWVYDEFDLSKKNLSHSDTRYIMYWNFITCACTVSLVMLLTEANNFCLSRKNNADMEKIMKTVEAYMASATKDEYEAIAQTIRRDLVFSEFGEDIENYVYYIPNTADKCITCEKDYPAQAFLVCLNTGEIYALDIFEEEMDPYAYYSYIQVDSGYDEVSQTSFQIYKNLGGKSGFVDLKRGRGIVSLHRMKQLFCDECIKNILHTVEGQITEEVVIFNAIKKIFYPINDGEKVKIGDYIIKNRYKDGDYKIIIEYANTQE